jgi:hypothetical protein
MRMSNILRESVLKPDGIAVSLSIGDYLMQQIFMECFLFAIKNRFLQHRFKISCF